MPCEDPTHSHEWPKAGPAIFHIQNCERLCAFCPHPKQSQRFSDASNLRAHVDHLHLKDMPGVTIVSAVNLRKKSDKEYAKVINAPPRNSPKAKSIISDRSSVVKKYSNSPEDPTLPSSLRVCSTSTPREELTTIRNLLFLKAEHHDTFHLLAEYHLQQAQYNAPPTDEETLSLDTAASFLRIYGARLWSNDGAHRTHLSAFNTLQNYTYWKGSDEVADGRLSGPYFALHSVVPGRAWRAWQDDQEEWALLKTDELAYSKLGALMRLYFSNLLGIGSVDESRSLHSKITTDPVQLLKKIIGGEHTATAPSKRKAMVVLKLPNQPATEGQRSSSPDIPLSALIDEWRSTHRLTEPPAKRLKVAGSEQGRKRPSLGKIITSPLPASSARTEPSPVSSEMLARVQSRRMSSTSRDGDSARVCVCPAGPKIPGPRNAYILYFQHRQAEFSAERSGLRQQEIAKVIGEQWRTLEVETKKKWYALADEEKKRHQAQYPYYRARKRSGRRNPSPAEEECTPTVQESTCKKCGGVTVPCARSSKKAPTAYDLFFQQTHIHITAEHPGIRQTEVVRIIGERWRSLSSKEKEEWKALESEEKRHHTEQDVQGIARRGRQSVIPLVVEATFAVEKPTYNEYGGSAASSMALNSGNAPAASTSVNELLSQPMSVSNVVRRSLVAEAEKHHDLERPSYTESQAPKPTRRLPVSLSEAEVNRNRAELSLGTSYQAQQSNTFQLPTPRSSMQEISPQSAFDRNLALHLSSLPQNAEAMPPPARPWPTLPRRPDGYEFPRYGLEVWTQQEEEEMMRIMGLSGGEAAQQQLKSVDHFKAYEIAAGSLGGLPFC
ncbi:hypothetical protein TI39_contig341g00003 [Zymoseptoria brevis]|uniref:HMG box domain-containing protein n=1 Tax=Zymoseptoria brevis TaxID=1047168 RepID=A0A0F4GRU9_9PEZI|nr:hypothetical protein TI39_contig341g00003 [Zymoseptoria brevis]